MHSQSIVHRVQQPGQSASLQDCRTNVGLRGFLRSSAGGVASGRSGSVLRLQGRQVHNGATSYDNSIGHF
jgi:hypothetical protein